MQIQPVNNFTYSNKINLQTKQNNYAKQPSFGIKYSIPDEVWSNFFLDLTQAKNVRFNKLDEYGANLKLFLSKLVNDGIKHNATPKNHLIDSTKAAVKKLTYSEAGAIHVQTEAGEKSFNVDDINKISGTGNIFTRIQDDYLNKKVVSECSDNIADWGKEGNCINILRGKMNKLANENELAHDQKIVTKNKDAISAEKTPVAKTDSTPEIKKTVAGVVNEPKAFTSINEPVRKGETLTFTSDEKGVLKIGEHYYDVNKMPDGFCRFETVHNSGIIEPIPRELLYRTPEGVPPEGSVLFKRGGAVKLLMDVPMSYVGRVEPLFPKMLNHEEIDSLASTGEKGKILERSVYDFFFVRDYLRTGYYHNRGGVGRGDPYFPGVNPPYNQWLGAPDMCGRMPNPDNCLTYTQVKTMLDKGQTDELRNILGYELINKLNPTFEMDSYYLK